MITDEQITSALRKLGPVGPTAIANHLEAEPHQVGHRMRAMLEAKKITAGGKGRGRVYGLPDQKLEVAPTPPQPRSSHKAAKGKHGRRGASRPRAARKAAVPEVFTTAITADFRLVCVSGTGVHIFSEKQTEEIAEVINANFKA